MYLPPIDYFPAQYDPAQRNWRPFPMFVSQPSQPSAASQSGNQMISQADLYKYLYPAPPNSDRIVIGVQVNGTNTQNKKYLPEIYAQAGLEFCCHSCQQKIQEIVYNQNGQPTPSGLYSLIGDHQPPTVLMNLLRNHGALAQNIYGRLGQAAFRIRESNPPLTLFQFKVGRLMYQTNSYDVARRLGRAEPVRVIYGLADEQFLYPHCQACSDTQGRLLW